MSEQLKARKRVIIKDIEVGDVIQVMSDSITDTDKPIYEVILKECRGVISVIEEDGNVVFIESRDVFGHWKRR